MSQTTVFVLVHGAWQTAATWDLVVPMLRRGGHQVFTPSLTGLEGDPRELTDQVTLDTHIQDVLDLMESELSPTNIRLAWSSIPLPPKRNRTAGAPTNCQPATIATSRCPRRSADC